MLDALIITEAEAAGLSELAALDLAMARDFAARAQAAEDPETANALARSYQRMARSYRQSLALKARLRMETIAADREAPSRDRASTGGSGDAFATQQNDLRIDLRAEELIDAVERVIWAEHEPAEREDDGVHAALLDRFDTLLEAAIQDPRFGLEPLDDQVAATCAALGLDPDRARRWRDLPAPDFPDDGREPAPPFEGSG
ncbi:MAG: hypothetical protein JSR98_20035 [Proteobacteria bacterium]|nr:hypothetical protein [Pseudomonadota bacterium]